MQALMSFPSYMNMCHIKCNLKSLIIFKLQLNEDIIFFCLFDHWLDLLLKYIHSRLVLMFK